MGLAERNRLIKKIEAIRGSQVMCYLTTLRPGVPGQISEDAVRTMFDHLLLFPSRPVEQLDLFLCSNGGMSTVPWRMVALFREFSKGLSVLIPYRAYSAATMIALGADEIVMHPFGEMGPIDPTVTNEFNPTHPITGQPQGISVEDVKAYVTFIKSTVGITHEDELVQAIKVLAEKVHPLALGNVERFLSQSRMIGRKILKTHMPESQDHIVDEIVENLASKLYFHGHPINRLEAKSDLGLKVNVDVPHELEAAMWELYLDFEAEFKNREAFSPIADLAAKSPQPAFPQIPQMPQMPPGMPQPPVTIQLAQPQQVQYDLVHAIIESSRLSSSYVTKRRYTSMPMAQVGQQAIHEEILEQGWRHCQAPREEPPSQEP